MHARIAIPLVLDAGEKLLREILESPARLVVLSQWVTGVTEASQSVMEKMDRTGQWDPDGPVENRMLRVLWDLWDQEARLGILNEEGQQEVRNLLVRLELRALPEQKWDFPVMRSGRGRVGGGERKYPALRLAVEPQ